MFKIGEFQKMAYARCAECGYRIKIRWGCCPNCDGLVSREIQQEFIAINPKLKRNFT